VENKDEGVKLKRKSKIGPVLLSVALATAVVTGMNEKLVEEHSGVTIVQPTIEVTAPINIGTESINELNIILNNSNCSDTFFDEVCEKLKDDGISFTSTKNNLDINKDNSTVITLDQQYSAGENTLIFAPYDNSRIGNSDSLALAMRSGFERNGFTTNELLCSQTGYVQDEDGTVHTNVATDTEKSIDENNDTSFVTISFGTSNVKADLVAKSIEDGLARQRYYLDNHDTKADLIYRASGDEELNVVADYFDTNPYELKTYNGITNSTLSDSQAVVNPEVNNIDAFNQASTFTIHKQNSLTY